MAPYHKMLVIIGPTASGKSDLALELARQSSAHLLSIDSMQVYRDMNIGTAKPTPSEQAQVPHHLIDLVPPNESFTVARFVELADNLIHTTQAHQTPLIATGGTPLYYKSLFEGLFEGPGADPQLRAQLSALPNDQLHARLTLVDPPAAARIHTNDTKRLIRALEVHTLTGRPISSWQTEWATPHIRHHALWFGLLWDRDTLNRRINARTKSMIAAGWLDEVRSLLNHYGQLSPTAAEATGYRQLIDHLQGRLSLTDAIEQIKISTRQLARRQMKWFRRFPNVHWLPATQPLASHIDTILKAWREGDAPTEP
ncbi:MAG: tRNA (adenosine(37)-N6)-dimethylallyltransferase MiaA [Planctomycetota bacterium]|nr:tRNA (adenosine(37)-N6)-dimethylallyltransferase MiaA [Planctomycetota bacterium]